MVGTAGPDVLHSESSGNFAGGGDETTKSRPSSSWFKADGLSYHFGNADTDA